MATEKTFSIGPVKVRVTTPDEPTEPKERLTRERIVDVALEQMKERGYEAVSMRSIATKLGTGPASLYAHVSNKDELDQLLLDRIAAQLDLPTPDPNRWQDQVRAVLSDIRALYLAHPGSGRASLGTIPVSGGSLRAAEGLMAILLAGGIEPQAASWFLDLGVLYVSALATEEGIWQDRARAATGEVGAASKESLEVQVRELYASLPPALYPSLSALAGPITAGGGDERFEFGLDVLLAGLEAVSARMKQA